jgi:hypothetical protein
MCNHISRVPINYVKLERKYILFGKVLGIILRKRLHLALLLRDNNI